MGVRLNVAYGPSPTPSQDQRPGFGPYNILPLLTNSTVLRLPC